MEVVSRWAGRCHSTCLLVRSRLRGCLVFKARTLPWRADAVRTGKSPRGGECCLLGFRASCQGPSCRPALSSAAVGAVIKAPGAVGKLGIPSPWQPLPGVPLARTCLTISVDTDRSALRPAVSYYTMIAGPTITIKMNI